MKLTTKIYILLAVACVFCFTTCSSYVYTTAVDLHNKAENNFAGYDELVQKSVTLYDAKYLTFTSKSNIANVNKEAFMGVTNIIMTNRKDGESLAWKWITENQPIPYSEFTSFYRDLSAFVDKQYMDVYDVEREKQVLVKQHNIMLKMYPNNVFNRYLNIQPMKYQYGYISDSTRKIFKNF